MWPGVPWGEDRWLESHCLEFLPTGLEADGLITAVGPFTILPPPLDKGHTPNCLKMEISTWPHALNSDVPAFSRRYAIPPEHGKRLERLAIGRCPGPPGAGWAAGWQPHPPRLPAVVCVGVLHCVHFLPSGSGRGPPTVGLSLDTSCTNVCFNTHVFQTLGTEFGM